MDHKHLLPKAYIENNLVNPYSAAYITFSFHALAEMRSLRDKVLADRKETEEDIRIRDIIIRLSDPNDFFVWMKKPLAGKNKFLIRDIMLNREAEITPMIQKKIITNAVDDFIECATEFFIECKENHSKWILDNYDRILSPYARSQMCLVLGFRCGEECLDFLIKQANYFVRSYPDNNYEQGPIIAAYMISGMTEYLGMY